MIQEFKKINNIRGTLSFSGDKSISHRVLIISSLASGISEIHNLSNSDDVRSTMKCLADLGIGFEHNEAILIVHGKGFKGYKPSVNPIYAGNSGTTARLLTGILAAQKFDSVISGDSSLSSRPMKRVIEPLSVMGANIKSNDNGRLPLHINSVEKLSPINYQLPVASAQVKSAILLAGLHLEDETTVIESIQTRNHTENLLGLKFVKEANKIISSVSRENYPSPNNYFIPGDISSAMFFVVLTLLTRNSQLAIKDISLNPTRIECLNILKRMGGHIEIQESRKSNNELFGTIIIKSSELINVDISKEIIPLIIDEIPILTVAGIFAAGNFKISGSAELRVKESDRIKSITNNLVKIGLEVEEYEDGYEVSGTVKQASGSFESFGDHRIAMAFAILSSLLEKGSKVENIGCASISNPDFLKQLESISN